MDIKCRACGDDHVRQVLDLGRQPASNGLLEVPTQSENTWPLVVGVCTSCWLMQTMYYVPAGVLFTNDYPYFSGQSKQWVKHCNDFAAHAIKRFGLNEDSCVIEVGGNDGTSLVPFKGKVAAVWNIEPCASVARASEAAGVPTFNYFFGVKQGQQVQADFLIANNVMAHTPDLNDFVEAIWATLKPGGTATIEFPWVYNLIQETQFDTIYHEHYSYFSLLALEPMFERHKLRIYDVDEVPTHGGSLRIYVHRSDVACPRVTHNVLVARGKEIMLTFRGTYTHFADSAKRCREEFQRWMSTAPDVLGFGAAAKGNTFLNYCGARSLDIPAVADNTPAKQGKYLPGSCIKVVPESIVLDRKPEYILILAWNWRDEIMQKVRQTNPGQKFVTAIPRLEFH
jgi:SAM-dependent methyltransferase